MKCKQKSRVKKIPARFFCTEAEDFLYKERELNRFFSEREAIGFSGRNPTFIVRRSDMIVSGTPSDFLWSDV
ncbi:MAG: hypothetical protein DBY44_04170 [Veillonellaceae bacterium]|nr:MAG: hypothetical protein DBY44_04170 [Veillonellaceae bacterium]